MYWFVSRKESRSVPRRRSNALLLMALVSAAGAAVSAGAATPRKGDPRAGARGPHTLSTVQLANGSGDGHAVVTVDPYGAFGHGSLAADPEHNNNYDLTYDPVGPVRSASTTFYSSVWFSGAGHAGEGGNGAFLDQTVLGDLSFTSLSETAAVSDWDRDGLHFHLVQELLPSSRGGSTLRQTYAITSNAGVDTAFDLIRHLDADLQFDFSRKDGGGVSSDEQALFEFDSSDDPLRPSPFVGIDLDHQANLGWRIAEYQFTDDIAVRGASVLDNRITRNQGPGDGANETNADADGNGLTDAPYDVTLTLGQTLSVHPGETVVFRTHTLLGSGAPGEVLTRPTNLEASLASPSEVALQWQDNSHGETGFSVERQEGESRFTLLGSVLADTTNYLDQDLAGGVTYTYRVRVLFEDGPGGVSDTASVETAAPEIADVQIETETGGEIAAGELATAEITLTNNVPAGSPRGRGRRPVVIRVRSSDPKKIRVPKRVKIRPGQKKVRFQIRAGRVTEPTQIELTFVYRGVTRTVVVTVVPGG
jgi:hypothetical protein